jgi:hypothetical protein
VCRELTGDAELKMDWTKPPTKLDAMGFRSGCLVLGDDQIAAWTDGREILAESIAVSSAFWVPRIGVMKLI